MEDGTENNAPKNNANPERSLSPILSNSNVQRKMIYDRKRVRTRSRTKLASRFTEPPSCNKLQNENRFNQIFNELQVATGSAADRLAKIRELQNEKKKLSDCLYPLANIGTCNYENKVRVSKVPEDFDFKKPISPMSVKKKVKVQTDVLVHDRRLLASSSGLSMKNGPVVAIQSISGVPEIHNIKHPSVALKTVNKSTLNACALSTGFCTGTGKSIQISSDKLKQHSRLFDDILNADSTSVHKQTHTPSNTDFFRYKPDSSIENLKNVDVTVKQNIKLSPEKDKTELELENKNVVQFKGFCTGAGKIITVSSDNLKRHSKLFDDILNADGVTVDNQIKLCPNTNVGALQKIQVGGGLTARCSGTFCDDSNSEQTVEDFEAHPRDILLMQTSITDTQMNVAADIALKNIDSGGSEWTVDVPNTPSYFENKIVEFNTTNDINLKMGKEEYRFDKNNGRNTELKCRTAAVQNILSNEMLRSKTIGSSKDADGRSYNPEFCLEPSITDHNVPVNVNVNEASSLNNSKSTRTCFNSNEHLISLEEICRSGITTNEQVQSISSGKKEGRKCIKSINNCIGFGAEECNFSKKLLHNYNELMDIWETFIKRHNNSAADVAFYGKESCSRARKHTVSESYMPCSKRIKFDQSSSNTEIECFDHEFSHKIINRPCYPTNTKFFTPNNISAMDAATLLKDIPNPEKLSISHGEALDADRVSTYANKQLTTAVKEFEPQVNGINFPTGGFKSASGKFIKMSHAALQKAEVMYKKICQTEDPLQKTALLDTFRNTDEKIQSEVAVVNQKSAGFCTAGGRSIKISASALSKAKNLFADDLASSLVDQNCPDVATAEDKGVSNSYEKDMQQFQEQVCLSRATLGSVMAKPFAASEEETEVMQDIAYRAPSSVATPEKSVQKISNEANIAVKEELARKPESYRKSLFPETSQSSKDAVTKLAATTSKSGSSKHSHTEKLAKLPSAKKKLGVSRCRQIAVSENKLQKAKLLFEDFEESSHSTSFGNASASLPLAVNPAGIYSSTPLKEANLLEAVKRSKIFKANSLGDINITPIKRPYLGTNAGFYSRTVESQEKSPIVLQEQTEGDVEKWLNKISKEYEDLQHKLKVILERKRALEVQKKLTESNNSVNNSQCQGILSRKKQLNERISLKQFVDNRKPGSISYCEARNLNVAREVLEITPKNAEYLHFNCNWHQTVEEQYPTIHTADGAIVVPNSDNLVGLSELKAAFETMPGVDPKLLPKGWVSNHFKWIVWKLASLERNFPDVFARCLCVENVMQQLKYRYEREIDKAERPALRKILEKDDVPQKRMVLCVADVIEVSDNIFELELTDGWYCVRTVIDQMLAKQISCLKIVVGTKLMVQCAELLNCEGCPPLEVPNNVRLKINFNCTRRAAWDAKLGYQRTAEPFPLCLRTVHPEGGLVGYIKVYIARVYPVRYMEKQINGKAVWRNHKAEEKAAEEWENLRIKKMELVQRKVQEDYEKEENDSQNHTLDIVDWSNISQISSPKLLYQMLENAHDPESLKNMLSHSQFASAMDYKRSMYVQRQQELSSRLSEETKSLKLSQRVAVPILKLQVVDVSEYSEDGFALNIWKPTEEHLQTLKEGCTFSVYYVIPKPNGDLATSSRTHFKCETAAPSKYNKMQRHLLPVSMVQISFSKPLFNEYDTVATVVKTKKTPYYQELWLTDFATRLLYVKIHEGPERCCLLDNVSRGQNVALLNLIFCEPQQNFAQAIANQHSVITSYPQYKFLQDGLAAYCEQLPKNLPAFLDECDKKIEACLTTAHVMKSIGCSRSNSLITSTTGSSSFGDCFDDNSEDSTVIPSRLTTTDVFMSLIDTDRYFDNT